MADDKRDRVIEARRKLRERFLAEMERTPSMADEKPMGEGPPNRHGMPRLPPGQVETKKWPVLDLGIHPEIKPEQWKLAVGGAVVHPVTLDWADFMAMEQFDDVSDFHCVTTWSRFDVPWRGVRLADVIALAEPRPSAHFVMFHAHDGYTTNVPLAFFAAEDSMLARAWNGTPLAREHGGPVRAFIPKLYLWKSAKWLRHVVFLDKDQPGFWEARGYHDVGDPWKEERYR